MHHVLLFVLRAAVTMDPIHREFQITLPSNTNMELYPQNAANNYTTKLCYPLNLQGNWEVALVDIQYPLEWTNAPADTIVGFTILLPTIYKSEVTNGEPSEQQNSAFVNPEYVAFSSQVKHFIDSERNVIESYRTKGSKTSNDLREDDGPFYMRCSKLTKFYFRNSAEVCEEIVRLYNSLFAKVTGSKVIPTATFCYNKKNKTSTFSFRHIYKVEMWVNNPEFMAMAGFASDIECGIDGKTLLWNYPAPFMSTEPTFDAAESLFIYTDITKNQLVGDTQAPLLGVAPTNLDSGGTRGYWGFNPPFYVPLNKSFIDTIKITIRNDKGEKVKFPNDSKLISRLHFRLRSGLL